MSNACIAGSLNPHRIKSLCLASPSSPLRNLIAMRHYEYSIRVRNSGLGSSGMLRPWSKLRAHIYRDLIL